MTASDTIPGGRLMTLDIVGTVVFTGSAVVAAVVFDGAAKVQGVVVDLVLFAIGVATFLLGYWTAVQRSRQDEMSVAELFFLLGTAIPARVKRTMNLCLIVQTAVAVTTAMARLSTPSSTAPSGSSAGSTLAFGVLVPMFGLGLNGLWAATHGSFGPRRKRHDDDAIG
jgi:hypothetical protein